jgi:hypothetical protein
MNDLTERMALRPQAFMSSNWLGQVHDSVLFDTIGAEVRALAHTCITSFETIPELIYDRWKIYSPIPFTGDVEIGPNYADMQWSVSHKDDKWITKGDWTVFK